MADQQLIKILQRGGIEWNRWRKQQPEEIPIDLREASLQGMDLKWTDLHKANLNGAILRKVNLYKSDLNGAYLIDSNLSLANLRSTSLIGADLTIADLQEANLLDATIHEANLQGANLQRANLQGANLQGADLRDAILNGANLRGTNLRGANLQGSDLRDADLRGAILHEARLHRSRFGATIVANVNLSESRGLAEIDHQGPSDITLHTVQLPQDGSFLHFLRGVGISDEWIDNYRTSMMSPIQYHSCFISYSSKDEAAARRLHADLQDHGVRCWFAPEDMKIGDKIRARIDEAIHMQDKLLLLLSKHAIASIWVEDEVEAALEKEQRQQREVLFPIRLDEQVMQASQAWAAKLRRRHIGDFTHWTKPQAYQQAFERLLRDLKHNKEKSTL